MNKVQDSLFTAFQLFLVATSALGTLLIALALIQAILIAPFFR